MISSGAIYGKTRAGLEEIKSRRIKMPSKLRTMLILVDGTKPALLLREEAQALAVEGDFLEQLEKFGLVEKVGAVATGAAAAEQRNEREAADDPAQALANLDKLARFRMAQQFMNDTVVNALGIKAFFFTLKLERCSTIEDLGALAQAYRDAIAKGSSAAEAEVLGRRLDELLATN